MANPESKATSLPAHLWKPGQSGNPGGRPKAAITARAACRALNEETLEVLVGLMRNSDDDKVRATCAMRIRDEANGKPVGINDMPREDDDSSDAAALNDADLLREAIERAKLIGNGN